MIRTYTRLVGVSLILVGLLSLAGLTGTNLATVFYYVAMGGLFAYLGFLQRDVKVIREVIGGLGVLLMLVMGVAIGAPLLWGEELLLGSMEITYLVLGVLSILAARYLPDRAPRLEEFRKLMMRPDRNLYGASRAVWRRALEAPDGTSAERRPAA